MKNILTKLIWPVAIAPAIYLALVWNRLPGRIAMHFNLRGNPDRFGNKQELILLTVVFIVINLLVYFLLTNIHRLDPKRYAADNKERLRRIAFAVSVFMSAILFAIIYSSISGSTKPMMGFIFSGVGLLFAIIGNYLPNLKPNYFAGLRLPWTLEDPDNWKKTHALAGKLWFAGGLLLAIICLFTPPVVSIVIFFIVMAVIVIIPCIFSYRLFKQRKMTGASH
ncbi:MAG: SdpI family protein [Chitinophagaceae bacterium]